MSKQEHIFFDGFFKFKKKRNVEEYTLTINVYHSLKNQDERGKCSIIVHGDNPRVMSVEGLNKLKDFIDNSEVSKGVAMSNVHYEVQKYRGYLVASHARAHNLIKVSKG